jgi:hypothetical protein
MVASNWYLKHRFARIEPYSQCGFGRRRVRLTSLTDHGLGMPMRVAGDAGDLDLSLTPPWKASD